MGLEGLSLTSSLVGQVTPASAALTTKLGVRGPLHSSTTRYMSKWGVDANLKLHNMGIPHSQVMSELENQTAQSLYQRSVRTYGASALRESSPGTRSCDLY